MLARTTEPDGIMTKRTRQQVSGPSVRQFYFSPKLKFESGMPDRTGNSARSTIDLSAF
jgi:hypothetical protein